jgi:hypothetical protein
MPEVSIPMMTPVEVAALSVPAAGLRGDESTRQQLRDVLDKHGVAVVTGVLDSKECQEMEDTWKADLSSLVDKQTAVKTPAGRKALRDLNAKVQCHPSKSQSPLQDVL